MQMILTEEYKGTFKKFLMHHNIENIGRYLDAISDSSIKYFVNIDKKEITSLISVHLIGNDYYIEDILYDDNFIEVGNIMRYVIEYLKQEEMGLSIIYDNYPYSYNISSILLSCGFKCRGFDYEFSAYNSVSLIKRNIEINLKNDEVKKYMYTKFIEVLKGNDLLDDVVNNFDINLENTNVLVAKENDKVSGVLRFSVINESIKIDDVYADSIEIYIDLINMIKNLTNKTIEVNVLPSRRDLIEALNILKFVIRNADYKINL